MVIMIIVRIIMLFKENYGGDYDHFDGDNDDDDNNDNNDDDDDGDDNNDDDDDDDDEDCHLDRSPGRMRVSGSGLPSSSPSLLKRII